MQRGSPRDPLPLCPARKPAHPAPPAPAVPQGGAAPPPAPAIEPGQLKEAEAQVMALEKELGTSHPEVGWGWPPGCQLRCQPDARVARGARRAPCRGAACGKLSFGLCVRLPVPPAGRRWLTWFTRPRPALQPDRQHSRQLCPPRPFPLAGWQGVPLAVAPLSGRLRRVGLKAAGGGGAQPCCRDHECLPGVLNPEPLC